MSGVVHSCPTGEASARTSCCQRSPFELPREDRLAIDVTLVTCEYAR